MPNQPTNGVAREARRAMQMLTGACQHVAHQIAHDIIGIVAEREEEGERQRVARSVAVALQRWMMARDLNPLANRQFTLKGDVLERIGLTRAVTVALQPWAVGLVETDDGELRLRMECVLDIEQRDPRGRDKLILQ